MGMANVKVFKTYVKLQGQGKEVNNYGTNETPVTYHSKDMANVKVSENGLHYKVKVTRSKIMVPIFNTKTLS
jgi:hypothetical protein